MKGKNLVVVLGLLLAMTIPVLAGGPPEREGAWGNDQQYTMLVPKIPVPAADKSQEELYVIGAVDVNSPQSPGHGNEIGPHDHVIPIPPHNHGEYSAIWHVVLITPGPKATASNIRTRHVTPPLPGGIDLVYAADLGSGIVNLTSVEKLEKAGQLELITEVPIPVVFVCPIIGPKK